jgi:hypothetical protein
VENDYFRHGIQISEFFPSIHHGGDMEKVSRVVAGKIPSLFDDGECNASDN